MGIVIANADKPILLACELPYLRGCTVHLFQNDLTPAGDTPLGSFVECTFDCYAPQASSAWGNAYLNAANQGEADLPTLSWTTCDPAYQLIYGWYLTDSLGRLVCSQRDPAAPFAINPVRRTYTVAIPFLLDQLGA